MHMYHIAICGLPGSAVIFHIIAQLKKKSFNMKCVVWFSLLIFFSVFNSKKNGVTYNEKRLLVFTYSIHYSCPVLMKLEFSQWIF
jgi:hypothetical protein